MRRIFILLFILSLFPLTGCLPQRPVSEAGWTAADLRWLGKADAVSPATDILAVYTHFMALTLDIRVDLLDINPGDLYRIHLSLWDNRSFSREPLEIDLSAEGTVHTRQGSGAPAIWPRVFQDYELDTINISLNRFLTGDPIRIDVTTYLPGEPTPVDETGSIRSDGLPPPERAPFLLSFWNTFPAATPAQALRRWDGAHTGPLGDRNGLKYVLTAAKQYQIPLVLLDLKKPASLAALSYLDGVGLLRYMDERGLLFLPEVAYSQPVDMALAFSREAAAGFGLRVSSSVYNPTGGLLAGYTTQFVSLADPTHLATSAGKRLIPLPAADALEATLDGPSLEVRRALVKVLLSSDPADLVSLGGSLPDSTWGQTDMVAATLDWLDGHPWVRRLNADDLLAFPARNEIIPPQPLSPPVSPDPSLLQELRSAPVNAASKLAWQDYLWLNEPASDENLQGLRVNYLGQVRHLLAAARWADNPSIQKDCRDEAGEVTCVLSNLSYYASLDPRGVTLTTLFYRDGRGVHQLIGPTSQFAVGLSDPSEWKLEAGQAADPTVIPGGFSDASQPWMEYRPAVTETGLSFTSADGQRTKTFRLTPTGLEVDYQLSGIETVRIPLAVDPQDYYFGPVDYRPDIGLNSWSWGLTGGLNVVVSSNAGLAAQGFVSSYPFLLMPEDPNLDYPSGHYLPFPLSLAVIQGEGNFKVVIGIK